MTNINTDNNIDKNPSEEVINKASLEDVKLDPPSLDEGEKQEANVPETADFSNWYTLRVVSGKEKFVKENVFRELDFTPDLQSKINEIFVPFEKIVVIKNDKKKD